MKKKKLLTGEELNKRAKALGINLEDIRAPQINEKAFEVLLQLQVQKAERSLRESRLWIVAVVSAIIAVISAVASVLSAAAAIIAVYIERG